MYVCASECGMTDGDAGRSSAADSGGVWYQPAGAGDRFDARPQTESGRRAAAVFEARARGKLEARRLAMCGERGGMHWA